MFLQLNVLGKHGVFNSYYMPNHHHFNTFRYDNSINSGHDNPETTPGKGQEQFNNVEGTKAPAPGQTLPIKTKVIRAQTDGFNSVSMRFEHNVCLNPLGTCLICGDQILKYDEVNVKANKLAWYLVQRGVQHQQLVPVLLNRGIELVISVLAILKVGAAYVPINPEFPGERISYLLKDVNSGHVISDKSSATKLTKIIDQTATQIITIDDADEDNLIIRQMDNNPGRPVQPNDLAYVIYTSGSTGKPKGVMVEHGALLNYLINPATNYINEIKYSAGSYVYLSPGFDASITAMFMPLLAGKFAVITCYKDNEVFEDVNFKKYAPYDFLKTTPAHLEFLGLAINPGEAWITNRLVIGGEALHANQLTVFAENNLDLEIINEYGPTEATVGCSTFKFHLADLSNYPGDIPIGSPIENTTLYIFKEVDGSLHPSNEGEIYIGGRGLARGYLHNDQLTKERFINNPVANKSSLILYKTGDIGRWVDKGGLCYIGRADNQVKIGGIRIEIGEIEFAVSSLSYVINNCVVVEEQNGVKKLVCFFTPKIFESNDRVNGHFNLTDENEILQSDTEKNILDLVKDELNRLLPSYMVPSRFVLLSAFPLTDNGKIDRKKLLSFLHEKSSKPILTAETKTEKALLNIWQKVLAMQHIGRNENFFELGGNSIQAARLFIQIRKVFGSNLPLSSLIDAPTIEQQAVLIENRKDNAAWKTLFPFREKGTKPPLFLVHGGAGNILFYTDLAQALSAQQPVYGITAKGLDGLELPHRSVEEMATYYVEQIIKMDPTGPYLLAGYCFGAIVCYEMAYQFKKRGKPVSLLVNINGISPTYRHIASATPSLQPDYGHDLQSKLDYHKSIISQLNFYQKCLYPFNRLKARLYQKKKNLLFRLIVFKAVQKHKMLKKIYNYYLKRGLPIPPPFAEGFYFNNNAEMATTYKPPALETKMVVFRSPRLFTERTLGWKAYVKSDLEIFDIPGQHANRRVVMHPPFVSFLADKIQEYIDNLPQ